MEKLLKVNLPDHRVTLQILAKIEEVSKAVVENKDTLRQDMTVHNTKFSEILNMLNLWLWNFTYKSVLYIKVVKKLVSEPKVRNSMLILTCWKVGCSRRPPFLRSFRNRVRNQKPRKMTKRFRINFLKHFKVQLLHSWLRLWRKSTVSKVRPQIRRSKLVQF